MMSVEEIRQRASGRRVTCVQRDPKDVIIGLGDDTGWRIDADTAWQQLQGPNKFLFYTQVDDKSPKAFIEAMPANSWQVAYLKTRADDTDKDNLGRLPECPASTRTPLGFA